MLGSKKLRVDESVQKPWGRPRQTFMIKRAVRCCRQCVGAGGERVPPALLGWYFPFYIRPTQMKVSVKLIKIAGNLLFCMLMVIILLPVVAKIKLYKR